MSAVSCARLVCERTLKIQKAFHTAIVFDKRDPMARVKLFMVAAVAREILQPLT